MLWKWVIWGKESLSTRKEEGSAEEHNENN
jgi:hypothetical protein